MMVPSLPVKQIGMYYALYFSPMRIGDYTSDFVNTSELQQLTFKQIQFLNTQLRSIGSLVTCKQWRT